MKKIIAQVLNIHNQLQKKKKKKDYMNKTSYH